MKSNSGASKRFRVKKNLIKRGGAFKNHILTKKDRKRKARLGSPHYVGKTDLSSVRFLLCAK